jgi:hypothetical protein
MERMEMANIDGFGKIQLATDGDCAVDMLIGDIWDCKGTSGGFC